nr:MAG TPA: hypothetical protein [Bacteriophage sp.]
MNSCIPRPAPAGCNGFCKPSFNCEMQFQMFLLQ